MANSSMLFIFSVILTIFVATDDLALAVEISVWSQCPNDSSCWRENHANLEWYDCCVTTFDLGMKGLTHVKQQENTKILTIFSGTYTFTSSHFGQFNNVNNIKIQANLTATIECSQGVGLSFTNSSNITIKGLALVHCGQLQNSTSVNQTTNMFIKTIVAIYFLYCKNIAVADTNVSNTSGTALVFYNVVGTNTIESCSFERNQFIDEGSLSPRGGGGGVYIEYSNCAPNGNASIKCVSNNDSQSDMSEEFLQNSSFVLDRCHFANNIANILTNDSYRYIFVAPEMQNHCALGFGGGVSLFFMGNAFNNAIFIINCNFSGNVGLWGGGLFIQIQDAASNNFIYVSNSNFTNNNALYDEEDSYTDETGGGGSRLAMFLHSINSSNTVIYSKCMFQQNVAYYGGGLSFFSILWNNENTIKLNECMFSNNTARIGSAVDFTILQWIEKRDISQKIIIPYVKITNCNFTYNFAISDGLIGLGAVNLNGINVIVHGYTNFIGNNESALSLTNSKFTVFSNSTIRFIKNKGKNGGAMALFGKAVIHAGRHSKFEFTENTAEYLGGAIYQTSSGMYDLIYSRDCFIHHNEFRGNKKWTTSFHFTDNTADGHPNSIYVPTLLPCVRYYQFSGTHYSKQIFCNNETWMYNHNNESENCSTQIMIAPTSIEVQGTNDKYIPGKVPIYINYTLATNKFSFESTNNALVANIFNNAPSNAKLAGNQHSNFSYISDHKLYLFGRENTTVSLSLETIGPIAAQKNISIKFQNCPPGFIFDEKKFKCVCAGSFANQVFCDEINYVARIARTSWIGHTKVRESNNTTLLVGFSPYVMKVSTNETVTLPQRSNMLDEVLCGKINRTGTLCGECISGYGVTVNTKHYDCVKCDKNSQHMNWLYYILSEFVPVTLFFISVFLFSMRITHGPLNSFVFFAQTVTTVIRMDAHGLTPIERTLPTYATFQDIYMIPYDFWNLNFFRSLVPGYCLSPHLGTLSVVMLGYLTALYPLMLIFMFMVILNLYNRGIKMIVILVRPIHYFLARFSQLTNLQQSITAGIAVFILMSYNKFANVSFNLIPSYHLYDAKGQRQETVFYHQGTKIFPEDGVWYFITAIVVLCTFGLIPPAILAYPSILKFFEQFKCFRSCIMTERYYPNHKLQAFLDEFHGCYRNRNGDGETDCRWFASFYFLIRIFLLLIYSQVNTWQQLYILQSIVFLSCAMLFAIIRPYREDWINNVDTCAFAILTTVSTISLYNLQKAMIEKKISIPAFLFQFILMMIPVIYCLSYYSFLLYKWGKEKWSGHGCFRKLFTTADSSGRYLHHSDNEHGLEDSTYLARFFDFIKASGRYQHTSKPLAGANLKDYGSMDFAHD